ncbi:MAG TPA: tripartite tricarboxylate transporter substrate binding protein [Xanthobacteraceae bacterium]|nr:tripartite tricarboxylate transporter substrate binding protein [Xanthobacteraceae bacterium]
MPFIRALATIAFSVSLVLPTQAGAQVSDFPNRKLTFIVGFAPGGGIDTIARVLAQGLTEQFGYQIVIENRPGAASNIAARAVANATPDGYTYLVTGNSLAINQTYYKNPGYTTSELMPVAFVARDSMAIAVRAENPARSLSEFIAAAKTKPISFGFGGSSARIGSEYVFNVLGKLAATGVPFQSGAPALNALLGGHVDAVAGPIPEIAPQVQQGKLRALAVTGPARSRALPDVPTLREAGLPAIEVYGWNGILAPAKAPPEIALKLNAALNAVVATPAVEQRMRTLGYEPFSLPMAETPAFFKESIEAWARMIREAGITPE